MSTSRLDQNHKPGTLRTPLPATPAVGEKSYWACFLHLYQPANQVEEIFLRVVDESYRPLVRGLLAHPQVRITLNLSGALTEQFVAYGCQDLLDGLRLASERGQIEFTDTAKYHALLPFLPDEEIKRQIKLNRETNRRLLGPSYQPQGFFPPEMSYSPNLPPILENLGYRWVVIDEIALNGKPNQVNPKLIYQIKESSLKVFFRRRNPSNLIMGGLVRSFSDFQKGLGDEFFRRNYLITGMDGETFGHHRPGLTEVLFDLLQSDRINHVFFSDLPTLFPETAEAEPLASNWASTEKDIDQGIQFLTWKDPENPIHAWQWELQALAIKSIHSMDMANSQAAKARDKLDRALSSDLFFWASAKPWWSLEVIEAGTWSLLDVIQSIPGVNQDIRQEADALYHQIIAKAFELQRTGFIRNLYHQYREAIRVPFKDKTVGEGKPWVYDAFITFMRREMKEAAEKENFEQALFWRDAIWKLETRNDIYDAIHAVDVLRKKFTEPELAELMDKYKDDYDKVASGQPESRGT